MDAEFQIAEAEASHEVLAPSRQTMPLVFASPHSGNRYPEAFVAASKLDRLMLRRSEDSFVDEIFGAAPNLGAPLLRALFPRAYVDPNREPFELDPGMFDEPLPAYANTRSPRVAAGLGTIARVVANGTEIYGGKLSFREALGRIRSCYWPYHTALKELIEATQARFGFCILVDCHSMPSTVSSRGGSAERGAAPTKADFVLGDCHGTACAPAVTELVAEELARLGYRVACNAPYSGGFVTRHYGRPREGVHALQIEISRRLYMDEMKIKRSASLDALAAQMTPIMVALAGLDRRRLAS
ncbi:MAG: N-formylglutamate amidohydrolase [Pseudomonadota bacterium]